MEKEYHIMFTGVGRRVELIQEFKKAAVNLNIRLKIYGVDMLNTAPALFYCDYKRYICGMKDEEYIPQLLDICKEDKIDLLIPTIDTDLQVLSENIDEFIRIGTRVLVSKPEKVKICRDKNCTSEFFVNCGVKAPSTFNNIMDYSGEFPCFIKPKDGSSSIDAFKINNQEELRYYSKKVKDYIIQPYIEGIEYTVDVFCDFDGNPIFVVPRIRNAVRSGEVLKTKIVMDDVIIKECESIIKKFQPYGPMTIQLIKEKITSTNYYIEINPRFGGGAPLSMKAGANSAEAILQLLIGERIKFSKEQISDGVVYSRFDQSVCTYKNTKIKGIKGIIFDLDDTLYSERQYVLSGFKAVATFLGCEKYKDILWEYFLEGKKPIDELLNKIGLSEKKEECLEVYRNHKPEISLYKGIKTQLEVIKNDNIKLGIITDGRVIGQQNKIDSLGIEKLFDDIIITDELGGVQFRKPNDIAFRIMQCRWKMPYEKIIYVGDNANKDFQAPLSLGMSVIHFMNEEGLYYSESDTNVQVKKNVVDLFEYIKEITK